MLVHDEAREAFDKVATKGDIAVGINKSMHIRITCPEPRLHRRAQGFYVIGIERDAAHTTASASRWPAR